ncbi:MAG: ABC transporter ATP-binding protein [Thermoanaerobaculum sp.]|nr:ABC transporter ATP-binding protein [Thermoanaerobaculum sp.]MDW7968548.1 ABC transporter ATP-binding protein [Thermoanaerobaculum sp.]
MKEAVVAEQVSKRFPIFPSRRARLRYLLGGKAMAGHHALEGVSFSVSPGEALGIVGENGAGKSTLLRIVAGVTAPDSGRLWVAQPTAAILELGLGFHPDFSGRENALLYGSLLGLADHALRRALHHILAFAELGEFADQPLRTYSSGMAARLAFAVATEVRPAVLVVDEALAVGDGAFQKKCVDRMRRFKEEGRAILFCSHSLYLVATFCERTLWLHQGSVHALGPTQEVLEAYQEHLTQKQKRAAEEGPREAASVGTPRIRRMAVPDLQRPREVGETLEVLLEIAAHEKGPPYHVAVALDALDGTSLLAATTQDDSTGRFPARGPLQVCCTFPPLPLGAGRFVLSGFLLDESGLAVYDQVRLAEKLVIQTKHWRPSLLALPSQWVVKPLCD